MINIRDMRLILSMDIMSTSGREGEILTAGFKAGETIGFRYKSLGNCPSVGKFTIVDFDSQGILAIEGYFMLLLSFDSKLSKTFIVDLEIMNSESKIDTVRKLDSLGLTEIIGMDKVSFLVRTQPEFQHLFDYYALF